MLKVTFDLNAQKVNELVERLPINEKVRLAKRLNLETWPIRFKNLLSTIDRELKGRRTLSDEKIVQIVKRVRKRNNA